MSDEAKCVAAQKRLALKLNELKEWWPKGFPDGPEVIHEIAQEFFDIGRDLPKESLDRKLCEDFARALNTLAVCEDNANRAYNHMTETFEANEGDVEAFIKEWLHRASEKAP